MSDPIDPAKLRELANAESAVQRATRCVAKLNGGEMPWPRDGIPFEEPLIHALAAELLVNADALRLAADEIERLSGIETALAVSVANEERLATKLEVITDCHDASIPIHDAALAEVVRLREEYEGVRACLHPTRYSQAGPVGCARCEIAQLREALNYAKSIRHIALCPHGDVVELPCELGEEVERLRAERGSEQAALERMHREVARLDEREAIWRELWLTARGYLRVEAGEDENSYADGLLRKIGEEVKR